MPAHEDTALDACAAIVAELRAAALDPSSDLTMAERRALAGLAAAVEAEVTRRAGVDPAPSQAVAETEAALAGLAKPLREGGEGL